MSRQKDLESHIFRLVHLARSAHLKRVLTDINAKPTLNFWRLILGSHLDISVLEWCKVFGSNAEKTHWKNVVPTAEHNRFRNELLTTIQMTQEEWTSYWESMKKYRDRQVAHYEELPLGSAYPVLDSALSSSYFYYKYLIAELRKLGETRFPDDLEEYCIRFSLQTSEIAKQAVAATTDIQEQVW